jgi:hypothetical protein
MRSSGYNPRSDGCPINDADCDDAIPKMKPQNPFVGEIFLKIAGPSVRAFGKIAGYGSSARGAPRTAMRVGFNPCRKFAAITYRAGPCVCEGSVMAP